MANNMTKLIAKHLSLHTPLVVASCLILACALQTSAASPIRVVIWDEQQPQQRMAYSNFLGNEIVVYLKQQPGLEVISKGGSLGGLISSLIDWIRLLIRLVFTDAGGSRCARCSSPA